MDDQLHISVDGEDLGILIGKHGSFLDTFEGFVRYIIRVRFPEIAHVDVDVMNYKQKRIRQLEDMVEQSVQKTKRTKRPVTLPPMKSIPLLKARALAMIQTGGCKYS